MKKMIIIAALVSLSSAWAEVDTVIKTTTYPDGKSNVAVEYENTPGTFKLDTFEEADQNNDGCIDKKEAYDKGIRDFANYAKASAKCLNAEEYAKAMRGE